MNQQQYISLSLRWPGIALLATNGLIQKIALADAVQLMFPAITIVKAARIESNSFPKKLWKPRSGGRTRCSDALPRSSEVIALIAGQSKRITRLLLMAKPNKKKAKK